MMLAAAALGAGSGLDRTAFGQTLFAHPAIVGAAAMGITGPTAEAALFLGVLTSLDATQIPVGPVRRRDFSSAAVFGVLLGAEVAGPSGWALVLLASLDPISDPAGVVHEAHKIRGASLSFGFERFASILQTVETRVLELTPEEIGRLLKTARETFEHSRDLVRRRYAYLAPVC